MHDQQSMEGTCPDNASKQPPLTLGVVIAYDDIAAGKRAVRVVGELGKGLGEDIEFSPLPWRFDLLADADWRDMAARDADAADMLVIAASAAGPIPPEVGRWFEEIIQRRCGSTAAVVALFGPEENPDDSGSSRLQSVKAAAHQAGLPFFAPSSVRRTACFP